MNILYIITMLLAYIFFMLIHKTEKKQNLITWLSIATIAIMCYNILICLIFSFIGILCTLSNLNICNVILSTLLLSIIIKSKKTQKYYIKMPDIIFAIILLIFVAVIAYKEYGFPFNIKYETTDGSTHYYYAEQFYETSELLYKGENEDLFGLYNSDFRLPGAYVNEGILFKTFDGIISKINLFIIFDLFILYISGVLFYCLIKSYAKENKVMQILAAIFAIIYMLGYQLNSMIYGYVYLSLALDMIIAFLLIITSYQKEGIGAKIYLPLLSLVSFGIFFSYAYFIPVIYLGILLDIAIKASIEDENILTRKNVFLIISGIIIPLILGIIYFIILPNAKGIANELDTLMVDGVIYKNYITNFLVFIPMITLGIISLVKNKKKENMLSSILLVLSILFALILFAGNKLNIVSEYYCFKIYYMIWPFVIYEAYKMISYAVQDKNKILKISSCVYTGVGTLVILIATLLSTNIEINNIFYHNLERIGMQRKMLSVEELELLERVKTEINNKEIYILNSKYEGRMKWMTILFDNKQIYEDTVKEQEITISKWLKEKQEKYYLAYYEDYAMTKEKEAEIKEESEEYKVIYKNKSGFILERK